jgi:hypothetical protein
METTMRLFLVPILALFLTTAVSADDEFLKRIFNGSAYTAEDSQPTMDSETPSDDDDDTSDGGYENTTPHDPDVDRYIEGTPSAGTPEYDDYVNWYLDGMENAYRPDGMTDGEFTEWLEAGCPGEEDAAKCGVSR